MTTLIHDPLVHAALVWLISSLVLLMSLAIPAVVVLVLRWLLLLLGDIREINRDYFRRDQDRYV